jgi:2,3-bisphosphoglycerate-dependent phosphoglycerate mutase
MIKRIKLFFIKKLIIINYSFIYQIILKDKQMSYLILVRHGQSIWNLENKFTGWVDVDLAENGKLEAKKAGQLIKQEQIEIDLYYSSFQLRAKNTLQIIQKELGQFKEIKSAWELNERHYGALTGLNKDEIKKKLGEEKVHQFRRSWDLRPEPLDKKNQYHPINIETYKEIPLERIPDTESLKDTYERVIKFYNKEMVEYMNNKNILISAHGNSIRALCKHLFRLDNNEISKLEIPTGNPLLIEFENNKISSCKYLDQERAKDLLVF